MFYLKDERDTNRWRKGLEEKMGKRWINKERDR